MEDTTSSDPSSSSPATRALFAPVDNAFLIYLRIIFGGIMTWEVCRYYTYDWIARYYIEPAVHFTYYGFGWLKPWPGDGMYLHFLFLGICSVCILLGFCYRLAALLFFLGFSYVFLLDQTNYLNHFYLICLFSFLLIFVPANRAFSIDSLLRPGLRSSTTPAWTLMLMRFQVAIPYFYGGLTKLGGDWLHGEPMRLWLAKRQDFPLIGQWFHHEAAVYFFVIGGLLLDLMIVPLLLYRRTRIYAFIGAIAFHLLNAKLFTIGIFPWFMLAVTIVLFPPDTPRRWFPWLGKAKLGEPPIRSSPSSVSRGMIPGLLAIYAALQILIPFRHLLYPGNVNWTEEGHRFSWRMKFRNKQGEATFHLTDPKTGQQWTVDPYSYLTPRQAKKMVTHPDMILQFAHYLAQRAAAEGKPGVEVRAHVINSLNGRPAQGLIDPSVDLARQPRNLLHASWVTSLTTPLHSSAESSLSYSNSGME